MSRQSQRNTEEYIPTNAEEKILKVWGNPEYNELTNEEKAKIADINIGTYYEARKKEGFNKILRDIRVKVIMNHIDEVLSASFKYGVKEKGNFQDRKMLLEMAELYNPKQTIINENNGSLDNMTDEELEQYYNKIKEQLEKKKE